MRSQLADKSAGVKGVAHEVKISEIFGKKTSSVMCQAFFADSIGPLRSPNPK